MLTSHTMKVSTTYVEIDTGVTAHARDILGKTRLQRLTTIGLSSAYLSLEAVKAAITEAKRGKNVEAYMNLVETLQKLSPDDPLAISDAEWVDAKMKQVKAEGDRLEHELKGYKNNLIKESIRVRHREYVHCEYMLMKLKHRWATRT